MFTTQSPSALSPVSDEYPNVFALAIVDCEHRYWCSVCKQTFTVPAHLTVSREAWSEQLAKALKPHRHEKAPLCECCRYQCVLPMYGPGCTLLTIAPTDGIRHCPHFKA